MLPSYLLMRNTFDCPPHEKRLAKAESRGWQRQTPNYTYSKYAAIWDESCIAGVETSMRTGIVPQRSLKASSSAIALLGQESARSHAEHSFSCAVVDMSMPSFATAPHARNQLTPFPFLAAVDHLNDEDCVHPHSCRRLLQRGLGLGRQSRDARSAGHHPGPGGGPLCLLEARRSCHGQRNKLCEQHRVLAHLPACHRWRGRLKGWMDHLPISAGCTMQPRQNARSVANEPPQLCHTTQIRARDGRMASTLSICTCPCCRGN